MKHNKWTLLITAALMTLISTTARASSSDSNSIAGSLPSILAVPVTYLEANTNAPMATNWTGFAAVSTVSGGNSGKWGGTFGAVYYIDPYVGTQIRFQYIDTGKSKWVLPNGTVTLQSAYKPISSLPITLRPMVEAGAATDLSGNLYAIAGAGLELDAWTTTNNSAILQRVSVFYGQEDWQGQGANLTVTQYGAAVNLNAEKLVTGVSTWVQSLFSKL